MEANPRMTSPDSELRPETGDSKAIPLQTENLQQNGDRPSDAVMTSQNEDDISSSRDIEKGIGETNKDETDSSGEPPIQRQLTSGEVYSVFTVTQKRAIILTGSFAAFFSPLSSSIYYPSLPTIAIDLHVSDSQINLTVTTYLIIQGLAPMMIAGFSDNVGRRPAYIICFTIYIIVNLGLALQNNYAALMVLRCLQSAGSSGMVALANGVVGDLITSSERGAYIAFAQLGSMLGPTISPILGGVIGQYAGWHWIFWFLFIFSIAFFIPLLLFLPETCRAVVDDGSIPPPKLNINISDKIRHRNRAAANLPLNKEKQAELLKNYKLAIPNPLSTLVILLDKEAAVILAATGLAFACFYAISTGASETIKSVYGFNEIQISLMFIPIGAGSITSAFTTGKLIDWNYRRHAKRNNFPLKKNRRQDMSSFPLELARLQIAMPLFYTAAVGIIAYGWVMNIHTSLAVPIVLLFLMGYTITSAFQCLSILMVDIYPGRPATATAANNLVRCELGAGASAAISPMANAMGWGWAYTTLALLFLAGSPALWVIMRYGLKWRGEKKVREEKAEGKKREREEAAEQEKVVEGR